MATPPLPVMKTLTWPQAAVILGLGFMLFTCVTILALAHVDVAAIFGAVSVFVVAMAAVFGVGIKNQLSHVQDISNGRLTDVMDENKRLQEQVRTLALMVNPPEPK